MKVQVTSRGNGKSISEIERELDITPGLLAKWKQRAEKSTGYFLEGPAMTCCFIAQHEQAFEVKVICDVLGVSRSGITSGRSAGRQRNVSR